MNSFKTLITFFVLAIAGMTSLSAVAGATAVANVTANIVPAVTASITGLVVLSDGASHQGIQPAQVNSSVSLSTPVTGENARFNIRSAANLTYSMSVSSAANFSDNKGGKIRLGSFHLPTNNELITSNKQQELHVRALLEPIDREKTGPYRGSVSITANFN